MSLKEDLLCIILQLSVFWNFSYVSSTESRLQTYKSKVQLLMMTSVSLVTSTDQAQSASTLEKTEIRKSTSPVVEKSKREVRETSSVVEKAEVGKISTSPVVEKAEVGGKPTTLEHKCNGTFTTDCPRNWLSVVTDCLSLLPEYEGNDYNHYKYVCKTEYGGIIPDETRLPSLGQCMKYLLQNNPVTVIRLQENKFISVSDMTRSTHSGLYRVFCVIDKMTWAPPSITDFHLETYDYKAQKTRRYVMLGYNSVRIESHEHSMHVSCETFGLPSPEVTISRDNVTLVSSRYHADHIVQNITCQDSGVYMCQAKNGFNLTQIQAKIQIKRFEEIEWFRIESEGWRVLEGDKVLMSCKAANCSEPPALILLDDTETVMETVHQSEYLIHEIEDVQCSDMGTYYCRLETEGGVTLQQQVNLEIKSCPPQVCRGENMTKTVHAVVGQNVMVSVCIISPSIPHLYNLDGYSRIILFVEKQNFSDFYYTATITISDVQEQDQRNITIRIASYFSIMNYTISLQVDTTNTTASSSPPPIAATTTVTTAAVTSTASSSPLTTDASSPPDVELLRTDPSPVQNNLNSSSQETMNHIYIVIIAVLIGIILAVIIGVFVFVHRYRGSTKEDNSTDRHASLDENISLCSLYDVIEDYETVLPGRAGGHTDTEFSDNYIQVIDDQTGTIEFEIPVTQFSRFDNADGYTEVIDDPSVTRNSKFDNADGYIKVTDDPSRTLEHEKYISPASNLLTAGVYEEITDDQPGSVEYEVHVAQASRVNDVSDNYTEVMDDFAGTLENKVPVDLTYKVNETNNYIEVIDDPAGKGEYEISEPQTSSFDAANNYVELIDDPTRTMRDEDPATQTSSADTVDTRRIYVELLDDPPVAVENAVPITQTVRVDTANNYDKLADDLPEIVKYDIPIMQTSTNNTDNYEEIIDETTETVENKVPATQSFSDGPILVDTRRIYVELIDEPAGTVSFGVSATQTSSTNTADNYVELIDDPTRTVRYEDPATQTIQYQNCR